MLIKVRRHKDGKIFTSDSSKSNTLIIKSIHFLEDTKVLVKDFEWDEHSVIVIKNKKKNWHMKGVVAVVSAGKEYEGSFVV